MEFFLFLVPFVLIRLWFHKKSDYLIGLSSDIAAALELGILSSFSSILLIILLGLLVPYSLLDAMLQREVGTRMRFSLFHYVKQARSFWSSARELGLYRWITLSVCWCVASSTLVVFIPNISILPLVWGIVALSSLGFLWAKPLQCYHVLHPLSL